MRVELIKYSHVNYSISNRKGIAGKKFSDFVILI